MSISLYQLTAELREHLTTLSDIDLPPEALHDTLEAIQGDFEQKVRAVVAFSRELDAEAAFSAAEAKRIAERAKALEARARSLRDYTLTCIQAAGYAAPLRFAEFSVSVAKNPPSVLIEDEAIVPRDLGTVIPAAWTPDKKRIGEALKAGQAVPGCHLSETTFRLAVR